MITGEDRARIREIAERHGATKVLLFGSSARDAADARDIDLGVEGVAPRHFFALYADLLFSLSKPVDVVDLSRRSRFADLVRAEGVPVYG
jgi:predicted nucleotidyltransferase